jgi:hypothetical protein
VPRVPSPDLGVTLIRETQTASCEDITPRSSLLQTHSSIPFDSSPLRTRLCVKLRVGVEKLGSETRFPQWNFFRFVFLLR